MRDKLVDLTGKIIVLTGACGFLGRSFARDLAGQGALVHAIDILPNNAAKRILGRSTRIHYTRCDITLREDLERLRLVLPRIDVLVNNAAMNPQPNAPSHSFATMTLEEWNTSLGVNLTGSMLACQILGCSMSRGSSIINIASIYGVVAPDPSLYPAGHTKPPSYGVGKAGLINFTRYLAVAWAKKRIRVNCLVLGGVENGQSRAFRTRYATRTPLGRMARPEDFTGLLVHLASDASSYSTGAAYTVDGGFTAW